ncbi:Cadmium, cobalt and zinc/H(+)-K(+) antiporter [Botrimarina colliarenosi]|uniref:Cadmium, cobalt and zinc/H(+)-K(+) antiporter n=1 Tax=Botrimarina colliarenosi TaxID=2528001 RepID=A0A5C5ZZ68_9BACT|nr:cation diffusion facilitator family transporter [Botrimarina colliarenosi]TWT92872.1 Cadmium, cobalt and zinc/H(+)-K(+) antiporter [Botrimarina colliarenosi]
MPHSHDHVATNHGRAFAIGVGLNIAYVLVEAGFGFATGSLALLSDAGHNLSDVFGLLLAWGGHALASISPSRRRTYGWRGATVLAALLNALLLLAAIGGIAWEAVRRFSEPAELGGLSIVAVAGMGVVINAATAMLFWSDRRDDLNIRGAFLHMAADTGVSVGVVVAGLGIWATGWAWIDPVTSLVIAAVVFVSTWNLLRESSNLAV